MSFPVPERVNVTVNPMPDWLEDANRFRGYARDLREAAEEMDVRARVLFDRARILDEYANRLIRENT